MSRTKTQNTEKEFSVSFSNGKVRLVSCPYRIAATDNTTWLTAAQWDMASRCQCNHCWANWPRKRWVSRWEWEDE